MSEREGEKSSYGRIQAKKTLREVLEVAISFEQSAQAFYSDLIPKVSKNLRWLVEDLAREEQAHVELFAKLLQHPDIERQIGACVETPSSDGKFSDCIHLPDLGPKPDDQAVLQYALGREQAAMEQYRALAASTEAGPVRDLFVFLANEETQHKAELEKLYYEVVHSGGV